MRGDLEKRLAVRAAREGWNIPKKLRTKAIKRIENIIEEGSNRDANVAIGALMSCDLRQKEAEKLDNNIVGITSYKIEVMEIAETIDPEDSPVVATPEGHITSETKE